MNEVGKPDFDQLLKKLTDEEVTYEYSRWIRSLQKTLLDGPKMKIISEVKSHLKINERQKQISFDPHLHNQQSTPLIDLLSVKLGKSYKILCPPTKTCFLCDRNLQLAHQDPTHVQMVTLTGPEIYSKFTYRCRACPKQPTGAKRKQPCEEKEHYTYTIDKWGNAKKGFIFYKEVLLGRKLPHIRGTNEVFGERDFVENYSNQLCHGFLLHRNHTT